MAPSSPRRQQIRPRYVDLAEFDDEFENGLAGGDNAFSDWPPAATVVRKPPPSIRSPKSRQPDPASSDQTTQPGRDATIGSSSSDVGSTSAAKSVRFTSTTNVVSDNVQAPPSPPSQQRRPAPPSSPSSAVAQPALSIIGTVQERPKRPKSTSRASTSKSKASRFAIARQMDEELRQHDEAKLTASTSHASFEKQTLNTGFPVVTHRDQYDSISSSSDRRSGNLQASLSEDIRSVDLPRPDDIAVRSAMPSADLTASSDLEEWLDEDGKPMSAFRKSRLMRQGARPASVRRAQTDVQDDQTFIPDPTRDPGGGADIDAISAVLAEVSRENEQKLRQMTSSEVIEEVQDLESLFGKDVLEALKNRRQTTGSSGAVSNPTLDSKLIGLDQPQDEAAEPERIRRQYFPQESSEARPELEWLLPPMQTRKKGKQDELRFDFTGMLLDSSVQTDQSYLTGLHHHGDNQDAPGYTFAELVHLTRSSVAAQRQLALNVLGRLCERYPAFPLPNAKSSDGTKVTDFLNHASLHARARVVMLARWLLDDRNFSVRSAALRCLLLVLRSVPSGPSPRLGATLPLDWTTCFADQTCSAEEPNDASDVERSIQKDWAATLLDSKIVPLFLEQTDYVITSVWEAETALEILYRIAACSSSHALRVFADDSKRVCDFVLHLGLQVSWPPVLVSEDTKSSNLNARPSLHAVRLLHTGILADRTLAQSMILNGCIDHLLRFVLTAPWIFEGDTSHPDVYCNAFHAYQMFDEILRIYTSLASYGMYTSLVGRTWKLWQESGLWVRTILHEALTRDQPAETSALELTKLQVARSIFTLLAVWTRSSQDPHLLMHHHDITWTQVRDWINLLDGIPDLPPIHSHYELTGKVTNVFGSLCQFAADWLACALQKDDMAIKAKARICDLVFAHTRKSIYATLHSQLANISTQPSLPAVEVVTTAVQSIQSARQLAEKLDRVSTMSSAAASLDIVDEHKDAVTSLIACSPIWTIFDSQEALFTGAYVGKEALTSLIASSITDDIKDTCDCQQNIVAVSRLDAGYSDKVVRLLLQATAFLSGDEVAHVLKPFLIDCVKSKTLVGKANASLVEPVFGVHSLFKPAPGSVNSIDAKKATEDGDTAEEQDEERDPYGDDIDPITGTKLWRCPASGLPLRADWPLLALDDLLHSATSAVFNRPDSLDADWQASELDIVRASLKLAVETFRCLLHFRQPSRNKASKPSAAVTQRSVQSRMPSPEQIMLGVIKVFMLEKDQPDTFVDKRSPDDKKERPAGALTGRDIFRDATVSSYITVLLDLVDELVQVRLGNEAKWSKTTTLETWTEATIGSGVSFYQYFTDFVGLYDSISFGDHNFARVVMTIANAGESGVFGSATGLAKDFRSLVWNDYRDSLRSMPEVSCPVWTLRWHDKDLDMLDLYARFLVSMASPVAPRKSIAYAIAVHHLRPVVQDYATKAKVHSNKLEMTVKSLIPACGQHILRDLLSHTSEVQEQISQLSTKLEINLSL